MAFCLLHYMFASVTAHVTALLPVMLSVGSTVQGLPMNSSRCCSCLRWGSWASSRPYGTGPSPCYYGSGTYRRAVLAARRDLRRDLPGDVLVVGVPWITARG